MLEFKPKNQTTLWDKIKTVLPGFVSVKPVDMSDPDSRGEFYQALAWEYSHGIVHLTPDGTYPSRVVGEK